MGYRGARRPTLIPMNDITKEVASSSATAPAGPPSPPDKRCYDRSIVEGPLRPAVWKIAWPIQQWYARQLDRDSGRPCDAVYAESGSLQAGKVAEHSGGYCVSSQF